MFYASEVYDKISLYDEDHLSNFSPLFITSIVYPELIRYSEKQDKVEKLINEISTHLFSEWDGFSIGLLQMKPEFAVSIEKEFNNYPEMKKLFPKINFSGETDSRQKKLNRLDRLCNSETQIEYLLAFTYIVKNKFFSPDINSNFIEKDILYFFCKAYNYGICH